MCVCVCVCVCVRMCVCVCEGGGCGGHIYGGGGLIFEMLLGLHIWGVCMRGAY